MASDPILRRHVVAAAARSDEPDALRVLVDAVIDPSRTIAREAISSLGERLAALADSSFAATVEQRLRAIPGAHGRVRALAAQNTGPRARGSALELLGLLGERDDIPLLVEAMGDGGVAASAERALQRFGADAMGPILAVSRSEHASIRASIISIVPSMAPSPAREVREKLRDALLDESPDVVAAAVRAIAMTGDASDMSHVAHLASHPDVRIAGTATAAVAALAIRFRMQARAQFASSPPTAAHSSLSCVVIGALARSGEATPEDVATLERALASDDPRTRRAAIEALAVVEGEAAVDMISFAVSDEEREVRLAAVRALGTLGRVGILEQLTSSEDEDPVLVAAALRAMGSANPEVTFRAAAPLVESRDPAIACAAIEALGRLGNERCREALVAALRHDEIEVVKAAIAELGASPDARALEAVAGCLTHDAWDVRRLSCELLASHKDLAAPWLYARLARERDPVVREALAAALSGGEVEAR